MDVHYEEGLTELFESGFCFILLFRRWLTIRIHKASPSIQDKQGSNSSKVILNSLRSKINQQDQNHRTLLKERILHKQTRRK